MPDYSKCGLRHVKFHGLDGYGVPLYVGDGCFHRKDVLCGRKFSRESDNEFEIAIGKERVEAADVLEEKSKVLASCAYENNTEWGKDMGLKYGCPVEDVITGLSIQCRGWKSVYYNPERKAFLGVAATTLAQTLVQHKRWSEGDFQILLSKYSPAWFANGKISLGLQLGHCCYCFWASNCLAVLYYSVAPSLYLLRGIPLFPELSSPWFLPFAYVIISKYTYSLAEFLWSGGTVLGWTKSGYSIRNHGESLVTGSLRQIRERDNGVRRLVSDVHRAGNDHIGESSLLGWIDEESNHE
ncbi:Cellulose synthase-like protein E1 [Hibiscus syriacus]|uniref:Cellulose synthase-like protein E1 n=1 Tax=Hibiscus syriacus TaxID=106335 RepID=A0A6A3CPS7_HIBSY|nr:Cellulose synthase-like protein E1 [Hibiscus syriacus]